MGRILGGGNCQKAVKRGGTGSGFTWMAWDWHVGGRDFVVALAPQQPNSAHPAGFACRQGSLRATAGTTTAMSNSPSAGALST